ncbi:MAG: AgmX/PglI C-terminal domain-containing protein [Bdellovibrionales bacterium]|nr:AgmX/PglI C-terminal domain-containing protein [Bdellovibrionales bacterium]
MRKVELDLEHRYKNRFVGRHRLRSGASAVLGSGRDADIRLLGDDVGGIHAVIELDGDEWKISDMGSAHGTWIHKKPIVEQHFKGTTIIRIGGHTLKAIPRDLDHRLFIDNHLTDKPLQDGDQFHQVVVRRRGYVLESHLLKTAEDFVLRHGGKVQRLKAPDGYTWRKTEFGDVVVQQRLVSTTVISNSNLEKAQELWDPRLKMPALVASVLTVLLVILGLLAPNKPQEEMVALKPDTNQYTKLIFDAKAVHKKREQSKKLAKTIMGTSKSLGSATPTPEVAKTPTPKATPKTSAQVVNRIKAAGLAQLIGKISKRAAKNSVVVESIGRTPDNAPTGPATSVPSTKGMKAGSGTGTGETFKVAGVATEGKGGGRSDYRGAGGLSIGNVGNASVGLLEEESEVEGGLDKEVIAMVIRSQLGQIRYCYERQLSASPELYGKVQIKFSIGSDGKVVAQRIGTTTLSNAMVEGCILRRVSGWQFPVPKGGTTVMVTYPFLFKATN